MKWTYTTAGNEQNEVPKCQDILVQIKSSNCYEVLHFYIDDEYGMVAPIYESYVSPSSVIKFIIITD